MTDTSQNSHHFLGYNNFVWFHGVVEDINDPKQLGRMRVRIAGFHTADKNDIPTEALPWAVPMIPLTSSGMSGIGQTPFGVLPGSWVVGFFRDGAHAQEPIIMGTTYGKIDEEPNYNEGFSDPSKTYPRYNKPTKRGKYPIKTDVNPLALKSLKDFTAMAWRAATRIKTIWKSFPRESYEEPESTWNPDYAKNHVMETESGHVVEFDDTKGKERIHEMHRSGTYREIGPDGTITTRILGDSYEIVLKDKNLAIEGDLNITVQGNASVWINGDVNQKVSGNYNVAVDKDCRFTVGGIFGVRAEQGIDMSSGADLVTYSDNKTKISTNDNLEIAGKKDWLFHFEQKVVGVLEKEYFQIVCLKDDVWLQGLNTVWYSPVLLPGSLPLQDLPPDVVNPGDAIPGLRAGSLSDLIYDLHPNDILKKSNINTETTDRVQLHMPESQFTTPKDQ